LRTRWTGRMMSASTDSFDTAAPPEFRTMRADLPKAKPR